ncbi:MAG: response regulator, partial [Clostridiales bacterium]|nr:response regulator [Clostridiales bacterium]
MIFCVEDDASIRDIEIYTLQSMGYEAEGFVSGVELFEALKTKTPELLLLDVMLPGDDGVTILKKLRADPGTRALPVIMAT